MPFDTSKELVLADLGNFGDTRPAGSDKDHETNIYFFCILPE